MGTADQRNDYDVIVVGLGGMGSAAACHLARRGLSVLGLERFGPAHHEGSSHGGSRIIRLSYFEDPAYVPLLRRAYELWRELEAAAGVPLLTLTGGLLLGAPASATIAGALRSAREWGLDHELLHGEQIRHRFPTLAAGPDTTAFHEPASGLVRPEATVAAHLRLAEVAGAHCRFGEQVVEWSATADGSSVTVRTDVGTYQAGRLVLCPGPWASDLLHDLGVTLRVERQVQTWFQPPGGIDDFLPERHPVWMWEPDSAAGEVAGFHGVVYGFPALDGPTGGVKLCIVTAPEPCTPDTIDRSITPAELDVVAKHVRGRLTVDPGPVLRADTCMFENTPDHHFVIGPHPRHAQVVVAAGFSGHGFKFVPVIGEILADLAADGTTAHPIALFDPGRRLGERV